MTLLTDVTLGIAVQVAAVIGQRRANRARRNRAPLTVATFTITPGSDLARALRGERGPIAQRAEQRYLDDVATFELYRGETA